MFTKLKVWWMLRCFKKGLSSSSQMIELRKRMESSKVKNECKEV